ncbi:MAG: hypothetical protein UY05_C0045G0005 [Candidatus Peregrinibacteria bacterium GW2011_GWA2_47_7]|nr:MAG: hypothetical protein UY05_C0045G0005 [Candidatus Peregrinibacteria bacterium GW2011_GWA2_47_7]
METGITTHKFVAVLNKKIPVPLLINALGHMSAGLGASYSNVAEMRFDTYLDKDGGAHQSISDNPFIILAADNSNKLRTLRGELMSVGIHFNDFTSTMTVGTYAEQKERTKNTPESELEYYGICMFGEKEKLNALTKKFSLWK